MNRESYKKDRIFPFVWPWKGLENKKVSLRELIKIKSFSLLYLAIIWSVISILGFIATRNCEGSWQLALQCEYAFWVKNLTAAPWIFVRNLFTTLFLHNSLDHILVVTVLGVLVFVQSHEVIFGFKTTALIFISAYLTVAPLYGIIFNVGLDLFPESEFFITGFRRNWTGGSIGMCQIYGSLATKSKKPWLMLSAFLMLELINYTIVGIDIKISMMHLTAACFGFLISHWFVKR